MSTTFPLMALSKESITCGSNYFKFITEQKPVVYIRNGKLTWSYLSKF